MQVVDETGAAKDAGWEVLADAVLLRELRCGPIAQTDQKRPNGDKHQHHDRTTKRLRAQRSHGVFELVHVELAVTIGVHCRRGAPILEAAIRAATTSM